MARTALEALCGAVEGALGVPLMPEPARGLVECATYRYVPGASDGALARARMEIRVFARTVERAEAEMRALRRRIVADGDSGVLEDERGLMVICAADEGGGAGYLRDVGMYFVKAGFDISARA